MLRIGLLLILVILAVNVRAQQVAVPRPGPRDTMLVSAILYNGEWMESKYMEPVFVSNLSPDKLAKYLQEYNRLKNAVYVTLPYARKAGEVINDVNAQLKNASSKKDRKKLIKSRESDLKKQFADPLSNLSVYQGKVLMKLINRETGNDCYEIIKEYRGGLNARMYQTVAFFFGSSLKQEYHPEADATDRQIENILLELNYYWVNRPPTSGPAK
jgi:hypothetical protein